MLARQKWEITTLQVLEAVLEERRAQVACYGHNDDLEDGTGPKALWLLPISGTNNATQIEEKFRENYDEHEFLTGGPTWMHLVREEVSEAFKEDQPDDLEAELLQVAALCVSWVETLRRRS